MNRLDHFAGGAAPVEDLAAGMRRYTEQNPGLVRPAAIRPGTIFAPPEQTNELARQYQNLPTFDERSLPAFDAMRQETNRQFHFLTGAARSGGLGIDVQVTHEDPYAGPADMMRDIRENRRLKVFGTGGPGNEHPYFSNDENDQFRAVHDAFGHAATGRGFDRHGEEAAWAAHAGMYGPLARRAMTTETRGQNSVFIASGGKSFPVQKLALLPQRFSDPTRRPIGRRSNRAAGAILQARQFNAAQFGSSNLVMP